MATIKSFTDIEQSRKLAEILPLDSADMHSEAVDINGDMVFIVVDGLGDKTKLNYGSPVWSLAALIDVIPKDKSIDCSISFGYYNGKGEYIEKWLCAFEKEGETTDNFIIETFDGDNPVDACVEMILKLHKLNLL